MTEKIQLLRAIADAPAEDTPRLVFADWLDECGEEERARFVRLQTQSFRAGLSRLEAEEHDDLYNTYAKAWMGLTATARDYDEVLALQRSSGKNFRGVCCKRFAEGRACVCTYDSVRFTYERGFVVSVATSKRTFCSGTASCPRCIVRPEHLDCVYCGGHPVPQQSPWLEALFALQPIRRVHLLDAKVTSFNEEYIWLYKVHEHCHSASAYLPTQLFQFLPSPRYATADEADAALSKACISLGIFSATGELT